MGQELGLPAGSSPLHRDNNLYASAVAQLGLTPASPRHNLAVECHRHSPSVGRPGDGIDDTGDGRSAGQLSGLAVDQDEHQAATPANRTGANGEAISGNSSPRRPATTISAVIGANRMPLR